MPTPCAHLPCSACSPDGYAAEHIDWTSRSFSQGEVGDAEELATFEELSCGAKHA